jgi:hypothetical protein
VPILSSPRQRRRLAWFGALLLVAGAVALVVGLLPTHGSGLPHDATRGAPTFTLGGSQPSRVQRAQAAAAKVVQPLADAFVDAVAHRRRLAAAAALLAPALQRRNRLADWRAGRGLPLPPIRNGYGATSTAISFTGPTTVGVVGSATPANPIARSSGVDALLAMRFTKTGGRWLVDYLHHGRSSRFVDATNYAPPGFLPGSHRETFGTWAALILGFLGVVAIVVFLDRLLSRPPRERTA